MTALAQVADLVARARDVLVITGAGMSADSGLPTYRGVGGLYRDTATAEGVPIELALSGQMLELRPDLTWRYVRQIEECCRGAGFHRGHAVLAEMEEATDRLVVLTQNVDGFHQAAGSGQVIDLHGDVHELRCTGERCGWRERVADYAELEPVPTCPTCGAIVRPGVVLFGEMLPEHKVARLQRELTRGFDLVLSIGTTSVFPYIAAPVVRAARAGVPTVEINPGETEVSHLVQHRLQMGAQDALETLWGLSSASSRRRVSSR